MSSIDTCSFCLILTIKREKNKQMFCPKQARCHQFSAFHKITDGTSKIGWTTPFLLHTFKCFSLWNTMHKKGSAQCVKTYKHCTVSVVVHVFADGIWTFFFAGNNNKGQLSVIVPLQEPCGKMLHLQKVGHPPSKTLKW